MSDLRAALDAAKPICAAFLAALLPTGALSAPTPDAGSILQQTRPAVPPSFSPNEPALKIQRRGDAQLPPSAPFPVKAIRISGNTQFDTSVLHPLVADAEGKSLTLAQLGELAARISDYYLRRGFPLAQAFIPAQTIQDGVVTIEVIEARYGKIKLDNESRVTRPLLEETLAPLQSGQTIGERKLDRSLLLLSDIPGVAINATLMPGTATGTSDLLVNITPGRRITGNVTFDDYGNRYTGRARLGATMNVINSLRHGDVFSISGLTSGEGVNYASLSYDILLNGQGTHLGGSYSALRYKLGDSLSALGAHGTAQVASLWATHPIVRTRDLNLYGRIQYDRMELRDHIDTGLIRTDRHLDTWTATISGDAREALLPRGIDIWSVAWTEGSVGFDNAVAQAIDAATLSSQGRFTKWTARLAHLQSLTPRNALYLSFSGQWTNTNLDPSEKMIAGGPFTVRAYEFGAVSGDIGYQGTAELRHDFGLDWNGRWQAVAFFDAAHVILSSSPLAQGGNSARLYGAGTGLNWAAPSDWSASVSVAVPVGPNPASKASNSFVRVWFDISKRF